MSKDVTNDELARMIKAGFDDVASRMATKDDIGRLENRMDKMDGRMDHLDARMGRMEADLNEIKGNIVYKFEFEDLSARVKLIEARLGIESGK